MKDVINFEISEILVGSIIILAFFLFTFMKLIKKYFVEKQLSAKHQQYYFLIELIIWIIFIIWSLKTILQNSIYFTVIVISIFAALSIWITWFVLRDLIAGIVFKFNDNYEKGQFIELENIKGFIEKMNYLSLDLITDSGETIKIPFGKIQGKIHTKSELDKNTIQQKFILNIPKNINLESAKAELIKEILLTPGIDLKNEPTIKELNATESEQILEIIIYALTNNAIVLIKNNLNKKYSSITRLFN